jgi:ABC-type multidrug transport system fused ATPase/permease subunit
MSHSKHLPFTALPPFFHSFAAARLIGFVLSAMRPAAGWLAAAYAVLLAGAGCQLYLPLLQGGVFNAISGGNVGALSQSMAVYAGLTAASLASSYFGGLLMEAAASTAMQPLYRRLFDHMLAQSPTALATVSPGELMSRTSGDAAVMYSLLTLSTYRVLEGFFLAFGSLGFLIQLFNLPYAGPRVFQSLVPAAMAVSLLEAAALAGLMRPVNLKLRQAMGRMFGE